MELSFQCALFECFVLKGATLTENARAEDAEAYF